MNGMGAEMKWIEMRNRGPKHKGSVRTRLVREYDRCITFVECDEFTGGDLLSHVHHSPADGYPTDGVPGWRFIYPPFPGIQRHHQIVDPAWSTNRTSRSSKGTNN